MKRSMRETIREYRPKDYQQIVNLFQDLPELFTQRSVENIRKDLRDLESGDFRNVSGCLIFYREEKVLGALIYRQDYTGDRVFELKWLATNKDILNRGIGYHLIRHAEKLLKNRARLIIFYTSSTPIWVRTKKFFRKLGYKEVAVVPDFWDDGDDRTIFWKRVKPSVG